MNQQIALNLSNPLNCNRSNGYILCAVTENNLRYWAEQAEEEKCFPTCTSFTFIFVTILQIRNDTKAPFFSAPEI